MNMEFVLLITWFLQASKDGRNYSLEASHALESWLQNLSEDLSVSSVQLTQQRRPSRFPYLLYFRILPCEFTLNPQILGKVWACCVWLFVRRRFITRDLFGEENPLLEVNYEVAEQKQVISRNTVDSSA